MSVYDLRAARLHFLKRSLCYLPHVTDSVLMGRSLSAKLLVTHRALPEPDHLHGSEHSPAEAAV